MEFNNEENKRLGNEVYIYPPYHMLSGHSNLRSRSIMDFKNSEAQIHIKFSTVSNSS
jgi:hypothetical protein